MSEFIKWVLIILSFVIFSALDGLEVNQIVEGFKPYFTALFCAFLGIYFRKHFIIWLVWILGLIIDTINGSTLGVHAIEYVFITTVVTIMANRIVMQNAIMQVLSIGLIILIGSLVITWSKISLDIELTYHIWTRVIASAIIWPIFYLVISSFFNKLIYRA